MQEQVRNTSERDFPKVDRFHSLHEDGVLAEPEEIAERIWELIERGIDPGSILDVRNL
jgi:hypothetical protein